MTTTLSQLEAFVTTVRRGTFTAAAAELGLSQPAVSDLIRRLELELDTQLFQRGARSITLTSSGRELLPYAEQSVKAAADGARAVRSLHQLRGGIATFGMLKNADYYMKESLPARFRAAYPEVRIKVLGRNSQESATAVRDGIVEAGLVALPIDDHDLTVLPIAREEIVYASANPDRTATPVTINEFCAAPLVLYDAQAPMVDPARRQLAERAQLAGSHFEPVAEVEFVRTALALVAAGIGDTILDRAVTTSSDMPSNVGWVSFAEPLFETLAFTKKRGQKLSSAAREMVRFAYESLVEQQRSPNGTFDVWASERDLVAFLR